MHKARKIKKQKRSNKFSKKLKIFKKPKKFTFLKKIRFFSQNLNLVDFFAIDHTN